MNINDEVDIRIKGTFGIFRGRITKIHFNGEIDCMLYAGPDSFNQEVKFVNSADIVGWYESKSKEIDKDDKGTKRDD